MTTADQREQARKVSHSAIERRRRERINDKIMQLKHLIPTCANQENLHKMSILQSAIDYITYLKQNKKHNTKEMLDLLHGKLQLTKTTKSMLPKEVEPYTNQFNIKSSPTTSPSNNNIPRPVSPPLSNEDNNQKAIKPLDLLINNNNNNNNNNNKSNIPSLSSDLLLTPALTPKTSTTPPSPTTLPSSSSSSSSNTTLNMSVKNLLC
ncbi:Myc-type, basic helix-loop-helix domain-containing protein [Cunninghamella echinulata]|nr:Myc-type, basic helix-loop-helix domain-containing protein [Cunninghamella echinulata]